MSAETVQEIIVRAVTDEEYRELLFSDPNNAIENYDLTVEEATALRGLERDQFDVMLGELEERVSRAGFGLRGTVGALKMVKSWLWISRAVTSSRRCRPGKSVGMWCPAPLFVMVTVT